MDIREQFAENLRHYMGVKNVRQQDLINNLGFSSATVSQWVNGKAFPRPSKIEILAKYLGIAVDDLYAGSSSIHFVEVEPTHPDPTHCSIAELKDAGVKRLIIEF